ncbi:MAG TPA: DoxX family protein [Stellaceae bacterium]|jgi:putative oxidoreductase|nr:DoxX family protein [Stellaceae bacterium]
MYDSINRPRYVVPSLGGLYAATEVYSWPLVRVVTGLFFVPHGMQKLFGFWGGNINNTIAGFAKQGLEPAVFFAYYIGSLEFFGGLLLAFGLLTRPVAALLFGFMAVAAFHVHIHIGWFWTDRGMEVPLLLMFLSLAFLIRGGGALSIDRALGREI